MGKNVQNAMLAVRDKNKKQQEKIIYLELKAYSKNWMNSLIKKVFYSAQIMQMQETMQNCNEDSAEIKVNSKVVRSKKIYYHVICLCCVL